MSADPKYQAALALHRFGLGPKPGTMPGSIAAVASDPRGALLAELDKPGAGLIVDATLMTAAKDHLRVEDRALAHVIFPGSDTVAPMGGLLA